MTGDFIELGGVRLHHLMTGPEAAPTLLVLHGASTSLYEPYMALSNALEAYRVIWLDRPGLGWSERPSGPWSPQREAELIAHFLTALGVPRVVVLGHSWGAAIALRLLMDRPDHVSGGVLISPAARAWVGEAASYNKMTGWPVIGPLISHVIAPLIGPRELHKGVASAFHPEPVPTGYIETARLDRLFKPSVWKANAQDMAQVNAHLANQETRYGEITQPVMILAGPKDTVVRTSRHAEPVAKTLPHGEMRLFPKAGHNLHHAYSHEVTKAVADVLARRR
ncbi:MAG: esterase [Oceanicaulis sp.]|uniref:alpha/beta fold hydrolase n=1 Tax=unclassified Oceanicaulis TaxID=2632123 RepID=UPI000C587368|nr:MULTISPECIES: alpha/beta hydrolase [unclassified Oceanicaulis]MAB69190.1 esterase [Oceanicaulis sp.]MBC38567.1 esterase [Oceanicaulis sp.]MBC39133.1 esterase [Oceanicaulis sp.]MBG35748.1 esterase [Oceanicaulis sp.]HCR93685.1 alpha/beta hydrolase [Oceanicaulis sp.]|tara:strand:+ start:1939 stop:2778 length:840 start_codon:yes stop_codon:yes gene_type:complete